MMMTVSVTARMGLKKICLSMLDSFAIEHPAGHQKELAARYVLRSTNGERVCLMFEKGEKSAPNLWFAQCYASQLALSDLIHRIYPASALYQPKEEGKKQGYGRHSALKSMRDLANVDLVRVTIERPGQMQDLLETLAAV